MTSAESSPDSKRMNCQSSEVQPSTIVLAIVLIGAVATLMLGGCGGSETENQAVARSVVPEIFNEPSGGITWSYPSRWIKADHEAKFIRVYVIPQSSGDTEPAQCSVFFMKPPLPGDTIPPIAHVAREFQDLTFTDRDQVEKNGFIMTSIHLAGTHRKPAGLTDTLLEANSRLLGVLVEGTEGNVFFQLVGPNKTVIDAAGEFNQLLNSIAMRK